MAEFIHQRAMVRRASATGAGNGTTEVYVLLDTHRGPPAGREAVSLGDAGVELATRALAHGVGPAGGTSTVLRPEMLDGVFPYSLRDEEKIAEVSGAVLRVHDRADPEVMLFGPARADLTWSQSPPSTFDGGPYPSGRLGVLDATEFRTTLQGVHRLGEQAGVSVDRVGASLPREKTVVVRPGKVHRLSLGGAYGLLLRTNADDPRAALSFAVDSGYRLRLGDAILGGRPR